MIQYTIKDINKHTLYGEFFEHLLGFRSALNIHTYLHTYIHTYIHTYNLVNLVKAQVKPASLRKSSSVKSSAPAAMLLSTGASRTLSIKSQTSPRLICRLLPQTPFSFKALDQTTCRRRRSSASQSLFACRTGAQHSNIDRPLPVCTVPAGALLTRWLHLTCQFWADSHKRCTDCKHSSKCFWCHTTSCVINHNKFLVLLKATSLHVDS